MQTDVKGLLTVGGLALDRESSRIYKNKKEIDLTGREFLLMSYLMENADKIISKKRLYEHMFGNTAAFVVIQSWYRTLTSNSINTHFQISSIFDTAPLCRSKPHLLPHNKSERFITSMQTYRLTSPRQTS